MGKVPIYILIAAMAFGLMTLSWKDCVPSADPEYVGVKKCKGCHIVQYKIWKKGKHSRALLSLKSEEKNDPKCLICHTTGYAKPRANDADLKNVQCESCHGPGSIYRSPAIMKKSKYRKDPEGMHRKAIEAGLIEPDKNVCTGCHNERCPEFKGFNLKKAIKKIEH